MKEKAMTMMTAITIAERMARDGIGDIDREKHTVSVIYSTVYMCVAAWGAATCQLSSGLLFFRITTYCLRSRG